ncbi:MAG: hypothetical protein EOS04_35700 [Mesorhizobium sp.]|nr:MAG: hypothetical protein EOS02_27510 [Mesorhizobium sp.]RWN78606.1 MAG: hypothetical protein EOS04_35700 [Mesorhizobium sp.]
MSASKNIRQALGSCGPASANFEAAQAAGWYVEHHPADVDSVLADLGLLETAQTALLDGLPLETVGERGPYGTAAQQRAWAAGRLLDCCRAIAVARSLVAERKAASGREAALRKQVESLKVENRAAWRQVKIDVPFQEPRPSGRVDWLLGET